MTRVGLWPEVVRLEQKRAATILWPALAVVPFLIVLAGPAAAGALAVREGKIARQGFDLHYSIVGSTGPYLVILSGGPGEEISSMQGIADELGKTNQCIMLEQRGTGRSRLKTYDPSTINFAAYIEDIEVLRQQLHVDKVGLLGNSWGMMLALAYGGTHPDRVRDIIVLGSGPITRAYLVVFGDNQFTRLPPASMEIIQYWSDPERREKQSERASFERTRATAPAYFYDRKAAFEYGMELIPGDFNFHVIPAFLKAEGDFDLRPQIRAITAPTLLVQGRQDLAGEANIDEVHQLIKGSRLEFIDKCGHMPWLERPAETWKIVKEFLAGIP
jgi:proline iminopeptidase